MFEAVHLQEVPSNASFDEQAYLAANPDIAAAVAAGALTSGRVQFRKHGRTEGRRQAPALARIPHEAAARLLDLRSRKLAKLVRRFDRAPARIEQSGAMHFLPADAGERGLLDPSDGISENPYDDETAGLLEGCADGLVLDVGAGRRPTYFSNVVNFEAALNETTDVLGDAVDLPFHDGAFDGVISIAVLEHVKDPFRCAAEMARVLKPGGWLKCCAPFLQPLHGFPHHYFNMTHEGLRALFEPYLVIERQEATPPVHPVWAIFWQLRAWADALPAKSRKQFLRKRVQDLVAHPVGLLEKPFARDLPEASRFELAAATLLFARKAAR